MRLQRYGFIFLAIYIIFIAGGYAVNVPEIRWFHHILMTILAAGWLGWRLKHKRGLPSSAMTIPLFAMLILGFATIPFSVAPRMALENMWTPLIFALLFFFLVNAFQRAQERMVMEALFLVSAIVIFLSIIQVSDAFFGWLGLIRSSGQGWIEFLGTGIALPLQTDMRIFLPLGVSTQVAGFVAPVIIICLAWAVSTDKKNYRLVLWGMIILLSIILILTFSRGGLISVMVGLFCFFVLRAIQNDSIKHLLNKRNLSIISALFALALVVGISVLIIGSQGGRRSGDSVRLDLWRSAVNMTIDNPIIGVGTGLYGRELREYRQFETARDRLSSAHNVYLTVTAEHGLGVILILLITTWLIGQSWWRLRSEALTEPIRLIRLNGMMAALIAFSVHNLFDTLTTYAAMTLFSLMVVYCTVRPAKSRLEEQAKGNQFLAIGATLVIIAYGIWFAAIVDRAHNHLINSNNPEFDQLAEANRALEIDPAMTLYSLQVAYHFGANTVENPNETDLATAISLYEEALMLEPTWDSGMINLAALYELNSEPEQALIWLANAQTIIPNSAAHLHWARIAEANNLADNADILANYERSLQLSTYLPLSDFWIESDLHQEALLSYMESIAIDRQYRIVQGHFPEQLANLVPDNPTTAAEWWIVGEHALTVENNPELAIEAFSTAIEIAPNVGDYYVSRARAYGQSDTVAAERDLQIARFLGTRDEYPNAVQSTLVTDPEEIEFYRRLAIPGFGQSQAYENVVFNGRSASFVPYASVRQIGRGAVVMQIWYDLAADYEVNDDIEAAIEVYEAIAFISPEDERAMQELEQLQTQN